MTESGGRKRTSKERRKKRVTLTSRIWGVVRRTVNAPPPGFKNWQETDRRQFERVSLHLRLHKAESWQCTPKQTQLSCVRSGWKGLLAAALFHAELAVFKSSAKNARLAGDGEQLDLEC